MAHKNDHSHHHHNGHSHHLPSRFNTAFAIATCLNLAFTLVETGYAFIANSSSLLADAGHNFGDVLGLLMAWGASVLQTRSPTEKYSFGYKKLTLLASLGNALLIVMASALILYESIYKFFYLHPVNELIVIIVALIGIFINGGTALLFLSGRKNDLNIKGAYLHLASDALISLGVVVTGIAILFTGWIWLDPLMSLIIVSVILLSTWKLLRGSVDLLLGAVPHNINLPAVRFYLSQLPGVEAIHDLHIWALSTQQVALTAHLVMPTHTLLDTDYEKINSKLKKEFHIDHVTLQIEKGQVINPCGQVEVC